MRRTLGLGMAVLLAAIMLVASAASGEPKGPKADPRPSWRVLVYLDADNNLDVYAGAHHQEIVQVDLDELMAVGSVAGVDVFVLVDRWKGPANLYKVLPGSLELTDSELNGQEANMGDPTTLRSFVSYTARASKAAHTLLVFWDHGTPEYVAWDDNAGAAGGVDILTHQEVVSALAGFHVDVIATDECLVGQIEVAYEYVAGGLRTDYLVASEGYTGWRGFPYDAILRQLAQKPSMSARELALVIVEETQVYFSEPPYMGEVVNSHSAIDLSEIADVVTALRSLTELMIPDMAEYASVVASASAGAKLNYGVTAIGRIDLGRFVEGISTAIASPEIRDVATGVLDRLAAAVVGLQTTQVTDRIVGGLGIYFPNTAPFSPDKYAAYAFASEGWLDFLQAYWAAHGAA